ncbi:MAG: hypothetical protein ACOY3L_18315 [Pseudomonadota bacterium]
MPTALRLAELYRIYDGPPPWPLAEALRQGGLGLFRRQHGRALSRQADRLADRARRAGIASRLLDAGLAGEAGATTILQCRQAGFAARESAD